ncbi:MAG: hypothetical protein RLZZ174_1372 [Pseudomonadota bacterium]
MGTFDEAVDALGPLASPMELQGLYCGAYCAVRMAPTPALWHETLRVHFGEDAPRLEASDELAQVQAQALEDEGLSLRLLLPEEDAPLADRAEGLARFCSAFLSGYGLAGGQLREGDREALQDLAAIAQLSDELDEDDDTERNLELLIEHVRIVVLNLAEPGDDP